LAQDIGVAAIDCAMSAEREHSHPSEQTCAGLGWIKFAKATGTVPKQGPELRCLGKRAAWDLGQRSVQVAEKPSAARASHGVANETWAYVCFGRLSMIPPPDAATSSNSGTGFAPPGSGCFLPTARCTGVLFRLDNEVANRAGAVPESSSVAASASPSTEAHQAEDPELLQKTQAQAHQAEDPELLQKTRVLAGSLFRGGSAVMSRAYAIVSSVTGAPFSATENTRPHRLATEFPKATQRICLQAGKIVKKSAETVAGLASLPHRLRENGGESRPGTD